MMIKMKNSSSSIKQAINSINLSGTLTTSGRVNKYDGHFLECDGFPANLGSICSVATSDGTETLAEIIGFKKGSCHITHIVMKSYSHWIVSDASLHIIFKVVLIFHFNIETVLR